MRVALQVLRLGPLFALAVLVVVMTLASPYFFTHTNLLDVGVEAAPVAIIGMGEFVVILTRGIDLSASSVAALSGVLGAVYFADGARSGALSVVIMIAVGVAFGLCNGLLYVKGRIPHPFIVTLGTLNIGAGMAFLLAPNGTVVTPVPAFVNTLGTGSLLGIPNPIIMVAGTVIVLVLLLERTQLGRWIYAIGGDPEAARRSGIPVGRVLIFCYTLSGLAAAIGGLVIAGRTDSGDPTLGGPTSPLLLQAITAVFIAGASFFGGRGHVSTVVVGALVLTVITNGLNLLNVSAFWQLIATGVVLILAVAADVVRGRLEAQLRLAVKEAQ